MKKYTKEKLILKLKDLYKKLNKTPTVKDLKKEKGFPSYVAFYTKFGSWNKALKNAGLKLNYKYKFYSKEELINLLVKFKKNKGFSPRTEDFKNDLNLPAPTTYFKRFGSWNNALEKAGLEINVKKGYTKEELILTLKNLSKDLKRTPMMKDLVPRKDLPEASVFKDNFGSWNNALKVAGLEVKYRFRKWKKEEIIFWLKKKYEELGKTPGIRDFDKDKDAPAKNTVRKLFGNWTIALREANIPVKRFHSKEELIKLLQKLARELNKTPTRTDMNKAKGYPSYTPFVEKFGSYTAACLRAGLIPNDGRNNEIWQGWEKHCIDMAKVIHKNIEIKKENIVDGIPDIYIKDKKLFIDAKTCGYKEFKEQVKKYCKNGHELEFWCIFKGMENRSKKVKYIYADELARKMKNLGRYDLSSKCYQFIKNVYSEDHSVLK